MKEMDRYGTVKHPWTRVAGFLLSEWNSKDSEKRFAKRNRTPKQKRWNKNFSQELSHALHDWTDSISHPRSEWTLLALNIFRHYTHKCCYHRPRHHACCRDVVTHTWELSARRDRGDEFMYSAADAEFSLFSVFFSLGLDTRECCVHTDDDARRKTRGEKAKKKKTYTKRAKKNERYMALNNSTPQ